MPWLTRGLIEGVVTTRFPALPDGYGAFFRSTVEVGQAHNGLDDVLAAQAACPTGAVTVRNGSPVIDRGRCILCGRCCELAPGTFRFTDGVTTAAWARRQLVLPMAPEDEQDIEAARTELASRTAILGRSIYIRHVDAGSDGSEEWEVAALTGPIYDVQRLGVFFTASPRHADLLLVTGLGTKGMVEPLKAAYDAMPSPKVVVAVGTDSAEGGLWAGSYAAAGPVDRLVPVDVYVPGSPPSPFSVLAGILLAVGKLPLGASPSSNGVRVNGTVTWELA
jgi:Ni,Fe-hydrogenase III small subunit/ferredoxin